MPSKNKNGIQTDIGKYIPGDWNFICDTCGFKRKASQRTLSYYTGDEPVFMTCTECADYRHPLNSPPPIIFDGQPVPDARPDATQDSNAPQWFVVNVAPSLMSWGKFPNTGGWGNLNFGNTDFSTSPIWTWSAFSRD